MRTQSALLPIIFLAASRSFFPASHAAEASVKALSSARPERKTVGGLVWRRQDYRDYVTKAMHESAFIRRKLTLSEQEFRRAEKLLQSGVVRKSLLEKPSQAESLFSVEERSRSLIIAGPAELVVCLQTMVQDELTFLLATSEEPSQNVLSVLSLVAPSFLEENLTLASQIAEDNYEGARRVLKPQEDDYRRAGKRVWFNRGLGTVTILDSPERIQKVREYLAMRPYAPRPRTY